MTGMRINRFIASTGEISRRKADKDTVTVDGRPVRQQSEVYLAMYKPRNVVTTMSDPEGRPCVRDYIPEKYAGVFPIGRLDFDAEGLLLLTNDGALANRLHHPSHNVPKTYVVKVVPRAEGAQLEKMRAGVVLDGRPTRSAEIESLHEGPKESTLQITLRQGLKNQIKRMAQAVGLTVVAIKRISVGPVTVDGIQPGEIRELTAPERQKLHKTLK
jgi:pseudouridine synthase